MPLIYEKKVGTAAMLGVWEIRESEEDLGKSLHLSGPDKSQIASTRNEAVRLQRLACRRILSEILGTGSLDIRYDANGKPILADRNANISFSHSGSYAAAIFSSTLLAGIDIEKKGDRILRVADRFMTPAEIEHARGSDYLEKLYIHWGAKEALYKLYGIPGLSIHQDIILDPFDYLCTGEGKCSATIRLPEKEERADINYITAASHYLVYSLK